MDDPEVGGANQLEIDGAPGEATPRSGRPPRSVVLGLVAVLMVAVAGSGLWLRRGSDDLRVLSPTMGYKLFPLDPGKTSFYLAGLHLRHPGKDIEILDVKVLTSPNVEYLGAFTVWPRDYPTNKYAAGPGFPPPELKDRHPALGVKIPASETAIIPQGWDEPTPLTVAVGFRISSGDVAAVNGVRVIYKLGGKTKHQDFHHAVIACVKPNTCKAKGGGISTEFNDAILRRFGLLPDGE